MILNTVICGGFLFVYCFTGIYGLRSLSSSLKYRRPSSLFISTEIEKCLYREYSSFFSPMEKSYYDDDVSFTDPLMKINGIEKYQSNVDMLAGRNVLGGLLFKEASISLHNITNISPNQIMTRWTLRVTVKALPWSPTVRFTGVSIYTLDKNGAKICAQEDYWDSINLQKGKYIQKPFLDGLGDFFSQLQSESGNAEMAAPEMPYELLRRAARYEVRRYPRFVAAETTYDQRPEGYDRLGSYVGGSNSRNERLKYYSPTIMNIVDESRDSNVERNKLMQWPLTFALPNSALPDVSNFPIPTISSVELSSQPSLVVAVTRFDVAATEEVVKGYRAQLIRDISADGLLPVGKKDGKESFTIAQYDALFSLNKRRNEVWVELQEHLW